MNSGAFDVAFEPPPKILRGEVAPPGSKSLSVRALLLAGFAHGGSSITGLLDADDVSATRGVLKVLGVTTERAGDALQIEGCGARPKVGGGRLFLGSAGTLARFLPGLLMASDTGKWRLEASPQLARRPLRPLEVALRSLGAALHEGGQLPWTLEGNSLLREPASIVLHADVSSQFVSGILMAAALAPAPLELEVPGRIVQPAYIAMTCRMLAAFGIEVRVARRANAHHFMVAPQRLRGASVRIEPDASTAGAFLALGALAGDIRVEGVGQASSQPDKRLADALEQLGARVTRGSDWFRATRGPPPVLAQTLDLTEFSDQAPVLAAVAALGTAPVTFAGIGHIRHHECDRLASITDMLHRLGGEAVPTDGGIKIVPRPLHAARLESYGDHRMAMAGALLATRVPGIVLQGAEAVGKTCPAFFEMLTRVGVRLRLQKPQVLQTRERNE